MLWACAQPPCALWKQLDGASLQWHRKLPLAEAAPFSVALHKAAAVAPLFAGFPRLLCVLSARLNGLPDVHRKKTERNLFLLLLLIINRMFQICLFFAHGKEYGHLADVETHRFYIQQLGKTMDVILFNKICARQSPSSVLAKWILLLPITHCHEAEGTTVML